MANSKEKIILQSKRWLCESLLNLMEKKPYEEITITEISKKADLSRRTFYRHFKNKKEVLNEYTIILFNDYLNVIFQNNPQDFKSVIKIFFTFWNKNIEILKILKKNDLFFSFIAQYNHLIEKVVEDILKFDAKWHYSYNNSIKSQYMSLYSIGGLWNILYKWIDDSPRIAPELMSGIIMETFEIFLL